MSPKNFRKAYFLTKTNFGFLMFSEGLEMEHFLKINQLNSYKV